MSPVQARCAQRGCTVSRVAAAPAPVAGLRMLRVDALAGVMAGVMVGVRTVVRAVVRAGVLAAAAAAGALWMGSSPAHAGDPRDHERARAAVQAGEVLPLPALLARLQPTYPGQVLELELEREDGRWIYEIKLLQAGGQLLKLEVDAGTGQVLEVRRRDDRKARPAKDTPP